MEVHVESANADMLPKSCYVSVRVGEVLKQGRYEPQRAYTFPAIDRRRDVRIDVYQHVGSCLLSAEPDSSSMHEVFATSTHPDFPAMKFKVNMSTRSEEVQKSKTDRAAKMKGRAKEYLGKHRIEEKLSEAVKALLKEQPADAVDFVCKYLAGTKKDLEKSDKQLPPLASGSTKASSRPLHKEKEAEKPGEESFVSIDGTPGAPQEAADTKEDPRNDLPVVRSQVCQLLVEAAENGQLETALKGSQTDPAEASAVEHVRVKTANLLMQAAENGDLEEAVHHAQHGSRANEEVRLKVANLLMSASENGDLHRALADIKDNKSSVTMSKDESRHRAAGLLIEAAETGKLEEALKELKTPTVEELTGRVAKALWDAMQSGELEKAIKELEAEVPAAPAAASEPAETEPSQPPATEGKAEAVEEAKASGNEPAAPETEAKPEAVEEAKASGTEPAPPAMEGKAEVVEETNASGNAA
ncbi:unnamed protein product [Symbiodinium pilosum]|uniref:Uncharacterized protein n=1 Tax=Symbiodinium pilosum TaxID=2952 RepID=A0A812P6Y2_SYMPI|nr:unnamed protein product [Symbiodinium pilosum]